jgi:hypothetical protein
MVVTMMMAEVVVVMNALQSSDNIKHDSQALQKNRNIKCMLPFEGSVDVDEPVHDMHHPQQQHSNACGRHIVVTNQRFEDESSKKFGVTYSTRCQTP